MDTLEVAQRHATSAQSHAFTVSRSLASSAGDAVRALDDRYSLRLEDGARRSADAGMQIAATGASVLAGLLANVAGALSDRSRRSDDPSGSSAAHSQPRSEEPAAGAVGAAQSKARAAGYG
jgi:hypothetical protein